MKPHWGKVDKITRDINIREHNKRVAERAEERTMETKKELKKENSKLLTELDIVTGKYNLILKKLQNSSKKNFEAVKQIRKLKDTVKSNDALIRRLQYKNKNCDNNLTMSCLLNVILTCIVIFFLTI